MPVISIQPQWIWSRYQWCHGSHCQPLRVNYGVLMWTRRRLYLASSESFLSLSVSLFFPPPLLLSMQNKSLMGVWPDYFLCESLASEISLGEASWEACCSCIENLFRWTFRPSRCEYTSFCSVTQSTGFKWECVSLSNSTPILVMACFG